MPYFVYLIISKSKNKKKFSYVGYTGDLKKRLDLHNSGKGAKFTRGSNWKLLYQEELSSKSEAMRREAHLKKDRKLRSQLRNQLI